MRQHGRTRRAASLLASGTVVIVVAGCGGGDDEFKNEPRPPVTTSLTGVITDKEVTVSPDTLPLAAEQGQAEAQTDLPTPIALTISNQTDSPHTVTLTGKTRDGKPIEATVPPIGPSDTAEIKQTLPPGTYEVRAGSEQAVDPDEQIQPATLTVNPNRQTSSDDLLLP
jgi:hypothetical protein